MTPKDFLWKRFVESAKSQEYGDPPSWQIEEDWLWKDENDWRPLSNPWLDAWVWKKAVQDLTGPEFEWFLVGLFQFLRFPAKRTRQSHDAGVDLVVKTAAGSVAIQAKMWRGPIGRKAVLEVAVGKIMYGADHGAVFAPNGFMPSSIACADTLNIELFDINRLFDDVVKWPQLFVSSFLAEAKVADTNGDVYLFSESPSKKRHSGVFFRADELRPVHPIIPLRTACHSA